MLDIFQYSMELIAMINGHYILEVIIQINIIAWAESTNNVWPTNESHPFIDFKHVLDEVLSPVYTNMIIIWNEIQHCASQWSFLIVLYCQTG